MLSVHFPFTCSMPVFQLTANQALSLVWDSLYFSSTIIQYQVTRDSNNQWALF